MKGVFSSILPAYTHTCYCVNSKNWPLHLCQNLAEFLKGRFKTCIFLGASVVTNHPKTEPAKLVCIWAKPKYILTHLLCQVSSSKNKNSSYPPTANQPQRPTFQVVTEVDLVPQWVTENDAHKLSVPRPLHILPAVAVRVVRVVFESKWDPDGLTSLTTKTHQGMALPCLFSHKYQRSDLFAGPSFSRLPWAKLSHLPVGILFLFPLPS